MTDRRRRQYITEDCDFLTTKGRALINRWGHIGITIWLGFRFACQLANVQDQLRWRTDTEAKALMGLDGIPLVDNLGKTFTIAEFFAWTGRRRWTRTTRPRHDGDVFVTWNTSARKVQNRRSAPPKIAPLLTTLNSTPDCVAESGVEGDSPVRATDGTSQAVPSSRTGRGRKKRPPASPVEASPPLPPLVQTAAASVDPAAVATATVVTDAINGHKPIPLAAVKVLAELTRPAIAPPPDADPPPPRVLTRDEFEALAAAAGLSDAELHGRDPPSTDGPVIA